MEENHKPEPNVKKHLASLHKRIQHKYMEMQKRLEKSKSVDSISNLSDDFSHSDLTYSSMDDLRETEEVFVREKDMKTESLIIERCHSHSATTHDLEFVEASFAEFDDSRNSSGDWENVETESIPKIYLEVDHVDTRNSMESLNEVGKDHDDHSKTTPKTIRERFIAARERRREEKEKKKLVLSTTKQDVTRISRKTKVATVTLALIEVTGLEAMIDGKERFLFCRYRLGPEKGKSKAVKSGAKVVKWQELFNINMFDEHILEISCFDNKIFLGRHNLDLSELDKEKTHKLTLDLHGGETSGVKVFVLLTISGMSLLNTIIDIDDLDNAQKALIKAKRKHNAVGTLSVIVFGAKGLSAQDCYCVLKLANERLQTHTEYKTHDPNWMKIFTFDVTDITSILEVIVVEEKKSEEIAKISIPLLRIHNGENLWYALKDSTQRDRAKGNNPRILLEMRTSWNLMQASIRVINPKEKDYLETKHKLDRKVFARNLSRAKAVLKWTFSSYKVATTCFEWESRKSNATALALWIVFCYIFRIWMLPLLFLIPFVRYRPENYFLLKWFSKKKPTPNEDAIVKRVKEERSTLRQKFNSLTDMVQSVQNSIGELASLGESIKNLFNFTVPYLSFLAAFFILLITLVMYLIPLKYMLIGWGIHKFTRKILRPNRIPNNEIMDLLSRVPDDETLLDCEELPLELETVETPTKH